MGGWSALALACLMVAGVFGLTDDAPAADPDAPADHATATLTLAGTGAGGNAPAPPPPSIATGEATVSQCTAPPAPLLVVPPHVQACAPVAPPVVPGASHTLLRGIHCVDHDDPTAFRIRVIYARTFDDATWQRTDDDIRAIHLMANQRVDTDGMRNGIHADLPTECEQGHIKVYRETLWTPLALNSFGSITGDLQTRPDYALPNIKYWVYFDHPDPQARIPAVLGEATPPIPVNTTGAANPNNGFALQYAVTYQSDWHTWLHEGAHTMGAVQPFATHATNAIHCHDRLDIMCFNDGGPWGFLYNSQPLNCTVYTFDSGEDDYFSTAPAPGSYLDTHWNLGAPYHRFIRLDGSHVVLPILCDAERAVPGQTVTCTFRGGNPEASAVSFTVDWGDGVVDPVGPAPVGEPVRAQHVYTAPGGYRIHVAATDIGGAPSPSGGVPWDIKVDGPEPPVTVGRPVLPRP